MGDVRDALQRQSAGMKEFNTSTRYDVVLCRGRSTVVACCIQAYSRKQAWEQARQLYPKDALALVVVEQD